MAAPSPGVSRPARGAGGRHRYRSRPAPKVIAAGGDEFPARPVSAWMTGHGKGRASLTKTQRENVMTERQLSGSTALVTGASRGFGRAVAAALAKEGASVAGVARDAAALASVREQIGSGFTPVAADAADPVT